MQFVTTRKAQQLNPKDKNSPVHLHAGEVMFGRGQREIHTLLGSCIAIVLWHRQQKFCGVCHFALPEHPQGLAAEKLDGRYGDHCMELFQHLAEQKDTNLCDYQAKIFGGGNMLKHFKPPFKLTEEESYLERASIGEKNATAAFALLMRYQVRIAVADVGEQCYRKVYVNTATGEVRVQHCPVGDSPMGRK